MTLTLSTKNLVRWLLFTAVFVGVMSVALLVDARGIPEALPTIPPSHGATVTVESIVTEVSADNHQAMFEMDDVQGGLASWYGGQFHGRRTASGRRYDMHEMTAAHKSLPFGTLVQVENSTTGKVIMVEITDRGPFVRRRVIDLSYAAAQELGVSVTPVSLTALTPTAVREFYVDNDSTVLIIDADHYIQVRHTSSLIRMNEGVNFSNAMRAREANEELIISLSDRGLTFQRARASDLAKN
mgnify:CR=1 FL=1